ncbi:MAG: tetratricopeptide repeat protein [Acidobacteriota bacterium]
MRRRSKRALVNLAGTLNSRGGIEESERLMAQALEIAKASGDRALTALTLHGLSLSRYAHGEHEQALAIASESASLFAAIGDRRNEATCLVNISASQYHLGRLPEAIGALEKAIPIVREMGDRPVEMMALKNLTEMRFETGDISEARALNARALALSRQMRSTRNEAMILASEADMERLTGDLDRATRLLEDASRIAAGVGDAYQRILLGISRARLALARGEDAAGILATTRSDADAAGLEHHYARELDLVESAIAAARDGRELFRGEEPEAIPEPLRRALSRGAVEGG